MADDMHQPGSPTFDGAAALEASQRSGRITEDDRAYMHKFCDAITLDDAKAWLLERLENCVRHATKHEGADKRGWLEDAAFFAKAVELLQQVPTH